MSLMIAPKNNQYSTLNIQICNHQSLQTFVPSLQLAQISIFLRPCNIWLLKRTYSLLFHISLKGFPFRSPKRCCASLSKQQGTTNPSHVITGACHKRQQ